MIQYCKISFAALGITIVYLLYSQMTGSKKYEHKDTQTDTEDFETYEYKNVLDTIYEENEAQEYVKEDTNEDVKEDTNENVKEDAKENVKEDANENLEEDASEEESDSESSSVTDCGFVNSFVCNFILKNITIDCSLHKAFQEIHAKDMFYDKKVIFFNTNAKIHEVLNKLLHEKCSCCIIEKNKNIYGIVDTNDIVAFIIKHGYNPNEVISLFVRKLIYVYDYTNLLDITQYLKHGIRYVLVKNPVTSIISQGSVLRYIYSNKNLMEQDDILNTSIVNLKICKNQKILTASVFENILESYEKMNLYDITSLPVIDINNACVAILSTSDIKHIRCERLNMTCEDFLHILQKKDEIITFDDFDTIDHILYKMITFDVHHLYKLDKDKSPIGVISYVDIIKALF